MYSPGCARLCELNGEVVSAAYLLDLGDFVGGGMPDTPATVLYAFATLPSVRGHGIGGKVCDLLLRDSAQTAQTVCPAEAALFPYYERRYGYAPYFRVRETSVTAGGKKADISSVSAIEYGKTRENLLRGRAHIRYNERSLDYQHLLCANSGGGMVRFDGGCAAYEIYGGKVFVKEFLSEPDSAVDAASLVAALGADSAVVRSPCSEHDTDARPFAMLMPRGGSENRALSPWFGFAFD